MKKYFLFILFYLSIIGSSFSQTITNVGTDFWIAFPQNGVSSIVLKLFISSNYSTSGVVSSAFPGVNQSFTVIPGVVTQLTIPSGIQLLNGIEDKGIHVTSNDPVSVYGSNSGMASADAYLALPVNALGLDYRIVTFATTFGLGDQTSFSVVAVQDGTELTIFNHQTNSTTTVQLHIGQTYLVRGQNMDDDMTGSRVQSNVPVAVFGSAPLVYLPAGCMSGDHIVEQMFPYYSWGKNFVTVSLAGRDASGDIFRVVAAEDATNISINGSAIATINTGDYYEMNLTGNNSITTSKATILAQFAKGQWCSGMTTGDPMMMLIPPREQFLTNYTISTVDGFSSWVNIVAPDYAIGTIYQDGVLIPTSAFSPVPSTTYFGAQRPVAPGSHTFTSISPFGVFVYGWQSTDSYGYPGGCSLSQIGTVNSVTISPATVNGVLNVSTLCFTAHVLDNALNPVVGVLVNFNISGISNIAGTAYTDASGNAQYCYARTGTTTGTDNVYAECFGKTSTTSTAIWTLTPQCINPINGGTIGSNQAGCGSFSPLQLTSITLPSGQSGTLEYKWQKSTTSAIVGFNDIIGSNAPDFSPGLLTQTSWYRRVARVDCMIDWSDAAITNTLEMTVITPEIPSVTITVDLPQVCEGQSVNFTANPLSGGTTPSFQWKVNGINTGSNNQVFNYTPANGDCIVCVVTSNFACVTGNPATSNQIFMTVNQLNPVSLIISSTSVHTCAGVPVTFNAFPTNPGNNPVYLWKVNGVIAGSNNQIFTYTPLNGDCITCELTSDINCPAGNPALSNSICMTVDQLVPVSVTVTTPQTTVCAGTTVTFTANPTHGGSLPGYQWKVNAVNVSGATNSTYTYVPLNVDVITCQLTSSDNCVTGNPATSAPITMTASPILAVSVTIAASSNPFCAGSQVTFTATPAHGGLVPGFQWKVNGGNAGTNSPSFSYSPVNGDQVSCVLNSSASCITGNPALSNIITMIVNTNLPAGVSISTLNNPFCPGTAVTFTANPTNGGGSPSYQWKLNGVNAGPNSITFTCNPAVGDSIRCVITSNLNCVTGNPASSGKIIMNGNPVPGVSFTACFDTVTILGAQPFNLHGGLPLGGQYSGPGVNSITGTFTPSVAGTGMKTITYSYSNVFTCLATKTKTILVQPNPAFTCGNNLIDIRDSKVYPTVQIGSQCWMAANLNYGTVLNSSQVQNDNCLSEKYCYSDVTGNCTKYGGLYQWDEVMKYDDTPAGQGLCPPGWHVPTEAEWTTLFNIYLGIGLAGKPLQDTIIAGFRAQTSGVYYLNSTWSFNGFATLFWTSTPWNAVKAISHGMNVYDFSVSLYPSSRANAFPVRCLRD